MSKPTVARMASAAVEARASRAAHNAAVAARITGPRCIVLARVEEDRVWDGEPCAVDLGHRPNLVAVRRAEALVWLLEGTADDVARAQEYAASAGYGVFVFPADEPDPLAKGKLAALDAGPT